MLQLGIHVFINPLLIKLLMVALEILEINRGEKYIKMRFVHTVLLD